MTQWKLRRPAKVQTEETATLESQNDSDDLRRDLKRLAEEVHFLRDQFAQALAGWREAQLRLLALEAVTHSGPAPFQTPAPEDDKNEHGRHGREPSS
jgi:hypothetical protein